MIPHPITIVMHASNEVFLAVGMFSGSRALAVIHDTHHLHISVTSDASAVGTISTIITSFCYDHFFYADVLLTLTGGHALRCFSRLRGETAGCD